MAVQRKATEPTIKDYAKDIFEIKGDIESIKRHMDDRKLERIEDSKMLSDIKSTLVGNNMNGNRGIIFLLNDIDTRLKKVEDAEIKRKQTENNILWIGGFVMASIYSLIVWIIQHLPKTV